MRSLQGWGWDDVATAAAAVVALPVSPIIGGYLAYEAWKGAQVPEPVPPPPASGEPAYVPVNPPPPPVAPPPVAPPPSSPPPAQSAYFPPAPQSVAPSSGESAAKSGIIAGVPNGALLLGVGALALVAYAMTSKED